jgi:hypothetical protein
MILNFSSTLSTVNCTCIYRSAYLLASAQKYVLRNLESQGDGGNVNRVRVTTNTLIN